MGKGKEGGNAHANDRGHQRRPGVPCPDDGCIQGEGYAVTTGMLAGDAHALIIRVHPDVVMLDVRMDTPDAGLALLHELRTDAATAAIPVLLCSADARFLRAHEGELRALGADMLAKPFDLNDLLVAIAELLRIRNGNGAHTNTEPRRGARAVSGSERQGATVSDDLPPMPRLPWDQPDFTPDRYDLVNAFTVLKVRAQMLNRLIFTASPAEQGRLTDAAEELFAAILRAERMLLALLNAMDEE